MSALIVSFWAVAALMVIAAHQVIGPMSQHVSIAVQLAAIVCAGFAYMALTAREATVDHALLVGSLWLLFSIIAEMIITAHFGHAWFELIGPPTKPVYRCLLMFGWVAAPALFARARA
ncbi:MAG TPA: hypothetical protein VGK31_11550 [Thermoanaerobaculia bacterium]